MRRHLLAATALSLSSIPATAQTLPSLSVPDVECQENEPCPIVIERAGSTAATAGFTYRTVNGEATAPADYTARSGKQSVRKRTKQQTVTVTLNPDTLPEGTERFYFEISNPSGATISRARATVTIIDDDAPPPPPPPPPPSGPGEYEIASPGLGGLDLRVAHDFLTDLRPSWGTGKLPPDNGTDPLGAYRQICGTGGLGIFDPALYPGQPGKGHLHEFSGKLNADANTTPASLIGPGESSCNPTGLNHSGQNSLYWVPGLFDSVGNVIRIDYNSVYYKREPRNHPDCLAPELPGGNRCIAFPDGLILFAGNYPGGGLAPANTSIPTNVQWKCAGTGAVSTPQADLEALEAISPLCPQLIQVVSFPHCWDGERLWANRAGHLAYEVRDRNTGKASCPATHPWVIPTVKIQFFRRTDANWGRYCLSSDMKGPLCDQNPTVRRGSTIHGDAILAWDIRVRDRMTAGCIDKHLNCSGGDLGDGGQFIGASVPVYTDPATGKRVTSWTIPERLTPISAVSGTEQSHLH